MKNNRDFMDFSEFQIVYDLAQKLIKVTGALYELNEDMQRIPEKVKVEIMRTHNTVCDLLLAIKENNRKGD